MVMKKGIKFFLVVLVVVGVLVGCGKVEDIISKDIVKGSDNIK